MFIEEEAVESERCVVMRSLSEDLDGTLPLAEAPRSFTNFKFLPQHKSTKDSEELDNLTKNSKSSPMSPLQSPLLHSHNYSLSPLNKIEEESGQSCGEDMGPVYINSLLASQGTSCRRVKVKLVELPRPGDLDEEPQEEEDFRIEIKPFPVQRTDESISSQNNNSPRAHGGRYGVPSNQSHFSINLHNFSAQFDGHSIDKRKGTTRSYSNASVEDRLDSRIDTIVDCGELLERDGHFMEYFHNRTPQRERLWSDVSDLLHNVVSPTGAADRFALASKQVEDRKRPEISHFRHN